MIFKGHKLTIGLDLGDSLVVLLAFWMKQGKIILEQKVATTPEAMKQAFAKIPQSLIAMETGTHSPWVSRLLTEAGAQSNCGARAKGAIESPRAIEKTIDTMRGHWHGWRESMPSCWGRCGIVVRRRKST